MNWFHLTIGDSDNNLCKEQRHTFMSCHAFNWSIRGGETESHVESRQIDPKIYSAQALPTSSTGIHPL